MKTKHLCVPLLFPLIMVAFMFTFTNCKKGQKPVGINQVGSNFVAGSLKVEKAKDGNDFVSLPSFVNSMDPGEPVLPVKIIEMALPPDADLKSVRLEQLPFTHELEKKLNIPAAPPYKARRGKMELLYWGDKPVSGGKDIRTYKSDSYYPSEPVKVISISMMRKWKYVRLAYYPIRYNPVRKTVLVSDSVHVNVHFDKVKDYSKIAGKVKIDRILNDRARDRFNNFRQAYTWYRNDSIEDLLTSDLPGYAIITTNATVNGLGSTLNDFISNKINHGYNVTVVTENQYANLTGQAPDKVADKIRKWLSNNLYERNLRYALLIGNPDPDSQESPPDQVGDVPMKQCWPLRVLPYFCEYPTDNYYSNLSGNWDLDGDGYSGEYSPSDAQVSPASSIDSTTFSIRWTGKINIPANGNYEFRTSSNDGVRVKIDNSTIVNDYGPHYSSMAYGSANLTQGLHDIIIEYYNLRKDAFVSIYWKKTDDTQFNVLSYNDIYYLSNGNYVAGGLEGEYFNNENYTNSVFKRVDNIMQFTWVSGDQGIGGVDFTPDVFVGRIPVYNNDLSTTSDILKKIINYENQSPVPGYHSKVLLPMKPSDSETPGYNLGEDIKNDVAIPNGYNYFRIYEQNYGLASPPEMTPCNNMNVLNAWKNSFGLVTWWTHGSDTLALDVFSKYQCQGLNDQTPSFTFQCSCDNGYPEITDNLGFSLLKKGAVSTISASRVSWYAPGIQVPDPISGFNQFLAYYYSKNLLEGARNGEALFNAKSSSTNWPNNMTFNIYGDPSLSLKALPDLTVVSKRWSISGQEYVIDIIVKNIGSRSSGESNVYTDFVSTAIHPGVNPVRIQYSETLPALQCGDSHSFQIRINLSEIHAKEINYIVVLVDPKNSVKESDEFNNRESWIWNSGL